MKQFARTLWSSFLVFVFVFGILGTLSVSHLIPNVHHQQTLASVFMVIVSLLTGVTLAKREPFKSFLARKSVNLFLFLFNGAAAVCAVVFVAAPQGVLAGIGLGVVSLAAGLGLILRRNVRVAAPAPRTQAG